ncbi:TonB-dependent receptor plug domain-containing protein [Sphingomonas sp. PR090111-T3T-6A]|uniref:TonB-dependent receptor plug domain-containing protein n=1 Tax=Sphingomonas sp. PR090111-T3T-6A TaxID=685778 RepID=UPI00037E5651|nr:TonB-dependent receptor [Sphingomonas sp. PR090111-T3T-6A]
MAKAVLLTLATLSSGTLAQVAPTPDAASDPGAPSITVTATRVPTPIDQVASSVTVLDKAAIDATQDIGISELLLRTPGISISRNGGYGTDTTLRLRGAEGDQTVIVLDGVKLTDPASPDGAFNLGNLLTGDAQRVEILRGPQSTLWGSQAIGGVVNIVTALPTRPLEGSFDIEGGSRDTVDARAGVGGKDGRVTWRLAGEAFTTDGISALDTRFGGQERDGYTNRTATGRVEIALTDDISADLRGYYARGRTDLDGFDPVTFAPVDTAEYETNRQLLGYAGLNADLFGGRLRNRIGYSYTDTKRNNFDPSQTTGAQTTFHATGSTQRIDYQGTLAIIEGWNAVFGVEHEHSRFRSISPQFQIDPDQGSASLTDEYVQVNGELVQGLTLTGGVRHDHYTSYGGRFLFSGGAAWKLPTGTILRASYGEGFKAPSLYQLYSQYGNPTLKPAKSTGWEAGVEQHLWAERITLSAAYFERRTRQQIIFNSCDFVSADPLCLTPGTGVPRFGYYLNLARAVAHGVELTGSVKATDRLTLDGNYSWTMAEDRSPGATHGNWLPRRPREEANGSVSYRWPLDISTTVAVRWAGHSFDDTANLTRLAGYTLVDLRAEVPVAGRFTLFARAENLLDKHYETAFQFGSLGRSVYGGVRARL